MLASAAAAMALAAGSFGPVDGRRGDRFEADEDVGQAGRVEPAAEPDRDLGRWREDAGHRADRGRAAGRLGEAGNGSLGQQAAGEPDDEQDLDGSEAGARRSVGGAEEPGPEPGREPAPDRRADRFADGHGADEADEDEERAIAGFELGQRVGEEGQGEDREDAAADRPEQPGDLRDGARAPAEDQRHDDQEQRDGVERVHATIVAQARSGCALERTGA